ncbi:MAG: hypothetical protein GXY75_04130 [Bacteroidales bacterium]|jgi:hypothetical protein|nr:hypothetical protein [Bacteroidales bacterium]
MKKLLSILAIPMVLASCYPLNDTELIEEIKSEFELPNSYWDGMNSYIIDSEKDYLQKGVEFSKDCTTCTVHTYICISGFILSQFDKEELFVKADGDNRLILTEKSSNRAVYTLDFTNSNLYHLEMTWKNHTKLEQKYIPDKSLSMKMDRVAIYWNHF